MSLLRVTRAVAMAAPRVQMATRALPAAMPARRMSDDIRKKESSMEKDFVARQERETLKRMLNKMEADADPGHKKALEALEKELTAQGIKPTEKMKQDLLKWRLAAH